MLFPKMFEAYVLSNHENRRNVRLLCSIKFNAMFQDVNVSLFLHLTDFVLLCLDNSCLEIYVLGTIVRIRTIYYIRAIVLR